jgi:hypothetical protein
LNINKNGNWANRSLIRNTGLTPGQAKRLEEFGIKVIMSIWPTINRLSRSFQECKNYLFVLSWFLLLRRILWIIIVNPLLSDFFRVTAEKEVLFLYRMKKTILGQ